MHEADVVELEFPDVADGNRRRRSRILRCLQNLSEIGERDLRLPVDVDDVPQLLHRSENEERIEEEGEELADRDLLCEDLRRGRVQTYYFLTAETETLYQLDVAQGFGRRACQRRSLRDNHLLNGL